MADFTQGRIGIWAITSGGYALALKIQDRISDSVVFVSSTSVSSPVSGRDIHIFSSLGKRIRQEFNRFKGHVFIFSTGIAVRLICPMLKSKLTDPAVVVMDDNGQYVISLVSGHIGGANELAVQTAGAVDAVPVITTATDVNNLPAIDMIAKKNSLYIQTPYNIKNINMAFLQKKPVFLYDPFDIVKNEISDSMWVQGTQDCTETPAVFCSHEICEVPRETMILRPPVLTVGIGCNRNTPAHEIENFLLKIFEEQGWSVKSIYRFASSDIKQDEQGLIAFSEDMKIKVDFFTREQLNSVETIENPSEIVEKHLGVKSVCEAAAILSGNKGKLIMAKRKTPNVTLAVAMRREFSI